MIQDLAPFLLAINAARSRTHIKDFYVGGRLSVQINQGYEARKQALIELIDSGLVVLDGSRLSLGRLVECPWLKDGLEIGSPQAWEIVDAFPKKARKYEPDIALLGQIGMKGELFAIKELERLLPAGMHARIHHLSLTDDSAGFDIATPSIVDPDIQIMLEVKTSTRSGDRFNFHLSRNEFEKAKASRNWYLLLIRLIGSEGTVFGYLEGSSILGYFPEDTTNGFSWTSAHGSFSQDDLRSHWP